MANTARVSKDMKQIIFSVDTGHSVDGDNDGSYENVGIFSARDDKKGKEINLEELSDSYKQVVKIDTRKARSKSVKVKKSLKNVPKLKTYGTIIGDKIFKEVEKGLDVLLDK